MAEMTGDQQPPVAKKSFLEKYSGVLEETVPDEDQRKRLLAPERLEGLTDDNLGALVKSGEQLVRTMKGMAVKYPTLTLKTQE